MIAVGILEEKIMTNDKQRHQHFCIFDYYLDGEYLKWEQVTGEYIALVAGQQCTVKLEDGTQITGEVIETISISEDERKVLLRSC